MAEVPADPGDTDLEQRILEVLRDAGSPVKTAQLLKKFQVPKKKLNQLLHKMKQESKGVMLTGPATWCLGDGGTKEVVPTERAERPQQDTVAIPKKPGPQLSKQGKHPGFIQHQFPLPPDSHGHSGSYTCPATTITPTERSLHCTQCSEARLCLLGRG